MHSCPANVCWLEQKKTWTNHSRLPDLGSALWTLRNLALDLMAPEKIRKVLWKVKTLQFLNKLLVTHKRLYYYGLPSESRWKKIPRRLNLLKGSRLSYKKITSEKKKILPFVQSYKVTPPLHHPKNNFMSKWHLIQPLQREIYKKPTLISYILVRSKNLWSRITLYRACTYVFGLSTLWLQQRRLDLW